MSVGVLTPRENNEVPAPDHHPSRALPFVWLGLVALLFLVFFGGNLLKLTDRWSKDPSYSHGFLVPFISLWLALRAYRRAGKPVEGDIRIGCMAMLAGAMLHLILTIINNPMLDFVAAGLVLWGVAVAVGGVEWAWGFPLSHRFSVLHVPAASDMDELRRPVAARLGGAGQRRLARSVRRLLSARQFAVSGGRAGAAGGGGGVQRTAANHFLHGARRAGRRTKPKIDVRSSSCWLWRRFRWQSSPMWPASC